MSTDAEKLDARTNLERLRARLSGLGSLLVCYSGGIDSAFVLAVASEQLGERAIGMTAVSPSLPEREKIEACRIASQIGAEHRLVESFEIEREGYLQNGPDRCFHCKSELYDIAVAKAAEWGITHIANGTNVDDLGDYRPGLEAAKNAGVLSPLVDLGFDKAAVRDAARLIGLEAWNKPAAACLSSRIPYGTSVTRERLAQIGGFEAALRDLGLRQVRVRWHDKIARIEVDIAEIHKLVDPDVRQQVVESGKQHGFSYVTVDLAGYRQGSHNEVLVGRSLRVV